MAEAVLFIGLQASGKTTFYERRFAATHRHVSKDNFPNNRRPERRQQELLVEALESGNDVVVDNTSPTRESRAAAIREARLRGYRVIGYYFQSSVQECLDRNQQRDESKRVPPVALFSTIKMMEHPALEEGFDELYFVRLCGGDFDVQTWQPEAAGGSGPV
jgi:predicted kinase